MAEVTTGAEHGDAEHLLLGILVDRDDPALEALHVLGTDPANCMVPSSPSGPAER